MLFFEKETRVRKSECLKGGVLGIVGVDSHALGRNSPVQEERRGGKVGWVLCTTREDASWSVSVSLSVMTEARRGDFLKR